MIRVLAYFVVGFAVSATFNGAYYSLTAEAHIFAMTKAVPDVALIMLNHAVFVAAMVLLYTRLFNGETRPNLSVFGFGACLGVIMFVPSALVVRGAWEVPLNHFFLIDSVFHVIASGLIAQSIKNMDEIFTQRAARQSE